MNENLQKIGGGFFNTVYLTEDESTVIKIPKKTIFLTGSTQAKISEALKIHETYLGEFIPQTTIIKSSLGPTGYIIEQEYAGNQKLKESFLTTQEQKQSLLKLIEQGIIMENETKLYFDLYGVLGIIKNTRNIFSNSGDIAYENCLFSYDKKIKFIDIDHIPKNNMLALLASIPRDMLLSKTKQKLGE